MTHMKISSIIAGFAILVTGQNACARFISEDPAGFNGGDVNLYVYVGNNPINANDPTGRVCNSAGGSTTCTPPYVGAPTFSFPTPSGFPARLDSNAQYYHKYNVPVNAGATNPSLLRQGIINAPTPGSPQPATIAGTLNNATPSGFQRAFNMIDQISSFGNDAGGYNNSPVTSYMRTDPNTGNSFAVNVTLPGHPLHPGYVARTVTSVNGNTVVNNMGEGSGFLQSGYSPAAGMINNVWTGQTNGIINGINSSSAAGGFVIYPSKTNTNQMRSVYSK